MKRFLVLIPLLLGAGCAKSIMMGASSGRDAAFPPRPADATYPNWEYVCGSVGTRSAVTSLLNAAGGQGWELVSFDGSGLACFKRPIPVAGTAHAAAAAPTPVPSLPVPVPGL